MAREIHGVLGEKLGMTQVFDDDGRVVPVTVVQAGPCVVTQIRTPDRDGYAAIQMAYGAIDPRKVNKPKSGHFRRAGVPPRRHVAEMRTAAAEGYTLGQELTAESFESGQKVDVTASSKGKGTSGWMKRHGFSGLAATHGTHRKHRSGGSIGSGMAHPARVFKGKRMPGRLGAARTTVQNLVIYRVDPERGVLLLKGAVPGPKGGTVLVRTAVKSSRPAEVA